MGNTPSLYRYRALRRLEGHGEEDFIERRINELTEQRARYRNPNRAALLARVAGLNVTLASHDDRTEEEIAENHAPTAFASANSR